MCSRNVLKKKMKKRIHVYYEGRVQGVGFRFTSEYVAQQLKLTGWVKNLPDGRVELVAEGKEDGWSKGSILISRLAMPPDEVKAAAAAAAAAKAKASEVTSKETRKEKK